MTRLAIHLPLRLVALRGLLPLLALALAACAGRQAQPGGAVFVVVRHAEKAADDPRDPSLSPAGLVRAAVLAARLDRDLVAAYATQYRRTQQTARPAAMRNGIVVTTYDAGTPAAEFAARLRSAHPCGTVLVVGHSNTVPAIAAALCGCAVPPMADDEFGTLYRIYSGAHGTRLQRERY